MRLAGYRRGRYTVISALWKLRRVVAKFPSSSRSGGTPDKAPIVGQRVAAMDAFVCDCLSKGGAEDDARPYAEIARRQPAVDVPGRAGQAWVRGICHSLTTTAAEMARLLVRKVIQSGVWQFQRTRRSRPFAGSVRAWTVTPSLLGSAPCFDSPMCTLSVGPPREALLHLNRKSRHVWDRALDRSGDFVAEELLDAHLPTSSAARIPAPEILRSVAIAPADIVFELVRLDETPDSVVGHLDHVPIPGGCDDALARAGSQRAYARERNDPYISPNPVSRPPGRPRGGGEPRHPAEGSSYRCENGRRGGCGCQ